MKKLIAITIIVCCFISGNKAWGQWSFTYNVTVGSNAWGCADMGRVIENNVRGYATAQMPTREDCERNRHRAEYLGNSSGNNCRIVVTCGPCTGPPSSNPNSQNFGNPANSQNYGNPNMIGTSTGQSFVTSHPIHENADYNDQVQTQYDWLYAPKTYNGINATGDKKFDDMWSKLNGRSSDYFDYSKQNEDYQIIKKLTKIKGGYQTMIELGKKNGMDFSNYISRERWEKWSDINVVRKMSSEEIFQFNADYNRFISDLYGSDPIFKAYENFRGEVKKELTDLAIKTIASLATVGLSAGVGLAVTTGMLTSYGAMMTKVAIDGGVPAAASVATDIMVHGKSWNDIGEIAKNAGNKGAEGFVSGIFGNYASTVAGKISQPVEDLLGKTIGKITERSSTAVISGIGEGAMTFIRGSSGNEVLINSGREIIETLGPEQLKIVSKTPTDYMINKSNLK